MQTNPPDVNNAFAREFGAGIAAHTAGRLDEAEAHYQLILDAVPEEPQVMRFFGILRHQQGRSDEGLAWLRRAIAIAPSAAGHNDLGNVLTQLGDLESASQAFLTAVELDATDANHWNNLGSVLQRLERHTEAKEAFHGALIADPNFVPALNNLGDLYSAQNQPEIAAEYYSRAYVQPPLDGKPWEMLGIAYYRLGDIAAAAEVYRQWTLSEPDNPRPHHMYAACLGGRGPARASDAYIEKTFDIYAVDFEKRLVGSLGYCGPQLVEHMLARFFTPTKSLSVLDGGCGTGLCGPIIAPYSARLIGIDLSANMLAKAAERNCYDALEKTELTAHLEAHAEGYDLIVMADTIIYFGNIAALFAAVQRALRPGGLCVFTTESTDLAMDYHITPSGRYRHASEHIAAVLTANGCSIVVQEAAVLRTEFGSPVTGSIFAAKRND